jgi:hypothetical protein
LALRLRFLIRNDRVDDRSASGRDSRGVSKPLAAWAIVYLTGGLVVMLMIDAPDDGGFSIAWRYLSLPLVALSVYLAYKKRQARDVDAPQPRGRWLIALAIFAIGMVCAPGYVMLVNSIGADGDAVTVEGPIVEKHFSSGKTSSYYVRIRDERTGAKLRLQVSYAEYHALNVGEHMNRTFFRGRLGLLYRWKL